MANPLALVHRAALLLGLLVLPSATAQAGEYTVKTTQKTEMKAVFGQVESRDIVQARARIGGTIVSLAIEEGSAVKAGDILANVVDDKIALQLDALDARIKALDAQMLNANAELKRGQSLFSSGTIARSRLDALQTAADVLVNQIAAAQAERSVVVQQASEGQVLAPAPGRVLTVPVTKGSVVMAGESIARIAGGGYFLRLSLPERHAAQIREGDSVTVGSRGGLSADSTRTGKLVKVYPEIEGGRVLADVEVDGLGDFFAGERTLVWIPVERRSMIAVPVKAISNRAGIDYVTVSGAGGPTDVPIIIGETIASPEGDVTEVLSGLHDGDRVVMP